MALGEYGALPRFEEMLASYLSPMVTTSLKKPTLPSRPCKVTSNLMGKAYEAAGHAGVSLHTMAILQVYQADLFNDLDSVDPEKSTRLHTLPSVPISRRPAPLAVQWLLCLPQSAICS